MYFNSSFIDTDLRTIFDTDLQTLFEDDEPDREDNKPSERDGKDTSNEDRAGRNGGGFEDDEFGEGENDGDSSKKQCHSWVMTALKQASMVMQIQMWVKKDQTRMVMLTQTWVKINRLGAGMMTVQWIGGIHGR